MPLPDKVIQLIAGAGTCSLLRVQALHSNCITGPADRSHRRMLERRHAQAPEQLKRVTEVKSEQVIARP